MGIILSALSAAGDAGAQSMNQNIEQHNKLDLENQRSSLETQKAKAIIDYQNSVQVNTANQQRQAMADRLAAAKQQIIDQHLKGTYGDYDAARSGNTTSGTPLTPEQQSVIDQAAPMVSQEEAASGAKMADDPHTYVKAALQTGDLDPKTAATLLDKSDVAQMRAEQYNTRTEMLQTLAEIRAKAMTDSMQLRLDAAQQKAANGKIDMATGRMLITSEDANIKAATSQIALLTRQLGDISPSKKDERTSIQVQIDDARNDIKVSKATKNMYMKGLGYPTSDDVPSAPSAPSAPTAVAPPKKPFNPADFTH